MLAALLLLTLLTVGISFLPLAGHWHIAAGLGIAVLKGGLVVLFFMHALHSPKLTWAVILVAAFWLLILIALTLCDYLNARHDSRHARPLEPFRELPGTVPVLRSPRSKTGLSPSPRRFSDRR